MCFLYFMWRYTICDTILAMDLLLPSTQGLQTHGMHENNRNQLSFLAMMIYEATVSLLDFHNLINYVQPIICIEEVYILNSSDNTCTDYI